MSKSDATKVTPRNGASISHPNGALQVPNDSRAIARADIALVREYVRYAVESLDSVIALEEKCGNRKPIVASLVRYRDDARGLLVRLAMAR